MARPFKIMLARTLQPGDVLIRDGRAAVIEEVDRSGLSIRVKDHRHMNPNIFSPNAEVLCVNTAVTTLVQDIIGGRIEG